MKNPNCSYCGNKEALAQFGYLAFETKHSLIIVFKEQSKPGRMIVAYKDDHIAEIKDLPVNIRNEFMQDVCDIATIIDKLYHPDRINYGAYGDTVGHLHVHLVPKYKDKDEWGGTFTMNNHKLMFDDFKCKEIAIKVKEEYDKLIASR